jgi:hypothetical protein
VKATGAILVICCSIASSAQVKISVSEPTYRSHDKIDVEVSNTGASDVKFCVEYGYVSFIDSDHTEATPTPVYVQQEGTRGWSTLLTGPDIGNIFGGVYLISWKLEWRGGMRNKGGII